MAFLEPIKCLEAKNHEAASMYILGTDNGALSVILGRNAKYKNLSTIGGLKDNDENVGETLVREVMEETLGVVIPEADLLEMIRKTKVCIMKEGPKGTVYVFFVNLGAIDMKKITDDFAIRRAQGNLTKGEQENDQLVSVPLKNPVGNIRDVCIDTIKWLQSNHGSIY